MTRFIVTLTLGLRPKQGLAKVRAKSEPESHIFMLSGMQESERMNPHIPK
jgi:hypothetical protein